MHPRVAALAAHLRNWANTFAARYGHPVYLVGSALTKPDEEPRDVDIVIILPNDEYWGRYGDGYPWWQSRPTDRDWDEAARRWARDVGKLAATLARECSVNADVKIQPAWLGDARRHDGKPRLRIDTIDELPDVGDDE